MPEENNEDSALERLRKRLYAPPSVDGVHPATLHGKAPGPAEGWKEELPVAPEKKRIPGSVVFLGFAVGFFALAGIVAAVVLFLGGRSVSADQLEIRLEEGPSTVSGGESVPLLISIYNGNPTVAQGAILEIDFPEGTFIAEDASEPLLHYVEDLGDIAAGETVRRTVRAAFFGEENQRVTIPMRVEYRTGQSNATFVSEKSYGFVISTAPVTLSVTTLSEVSSGQPFSLLVKARSNAATTLANVAISLRDGRYPRGFVVSSETPKSDGGLFVLGSMEPGEEKEIRITGTLSGQEGDERAFHFAVGSLRSPDAREFGVPYSQKETIVAIAKPFLTVGMSLNRVEDETVIMKAGEVVSALVSWKNSLPATVLDGRIAVKLSGDALEPGGVETTGFYRSADRTVLFESETTRGLDSLSPGDTGNGSFTFKLKDGAAMSVLRNPSVTLSVSISGRRVGQGNVPESVSSTLNRTVKVETDLSLEARAVRTEGPFENSGPWPPVAEKQTTYTVLLTAKNTVNTVAGTSAKLTLPSYVRFTGQANPASAVKYNETTRELTWTIGDMTPGASKSAAFQLAFLPSASQKGTSPFITSDLVISGHDRFVERQTTGEVRALSTETLSDPEYEPSKGRVE